MLINLSSFCRKAKTKFWSRKTSGREGLSEHRSYKTETIVLNHKLGECGGGADQTIRPVCTRWRCTFWSLPQAPQPYLLHLLSGWQRRGSTGRWQEVTEAPLKRFTRCMCFHLSSKMPERLNPLVQHQRWEISSQLQSGMFRQVSFVYPSVELYLLFLLQNRWT